MLSTGMRDRATHGPRSRRRSPSRGTADMKSRVALHEIRCRSPPAAIRFSPALRNVPMNCRHALLRFRHALDPVPQPGAPRTVNPTAVFGADCEGYDDRLEAPSRTLRQPDPTRSAPCSIEGCSCPSRRASAAIGSGSLAPTSRRSSSPRSTKPASCRRCSPSHDGDGRGDRRLRGARARARAAG